jgi:hypothetical protein
VIADKSQSQECHGTGRLHHGSDTYTHATADHRRRWDDGRACQWHECMHIEVWLLSITLTVADPEIVCVLGMGSSIRRADEAVI